MGKNEKDLWSTLQKLRKNKDLWVFQVALVVKNPPVCAGDLRDTGLAPGSGRSPGEGNGNPLQCSCLENSMHRGAWWATVHGVTESRIQLKELSKVKAIRDKNFFNYPCLGYITFSSYTHTHTHTHRPTHPVTKSYFTFLLLKCFTCLPSFSSCRL